MSLSLEDIDNEDDISIGPSLLSSKAYSFQIPNIAIVPRKESPEEKPIPFLSSFTRVNAFGAKLTCIKTDNTTKQIFLTSSLLTSSTQKTHSWLVGCNLDDINFKKLENKDKTVFSSQKSVFENLKYQFEDFFKKKRTNKLTVLTLGGKNSGKSYTLFGIHDNGYIREPGILFRFADYLFSNQSVRGCYIILRLYIVQDENVIDVLGSPKSYWHENNIFHTELSGPIILPLNTFVVSSLEEYMRVATTCLTIIAYTVANLCDIVSGGPTVIVSNTVVSPEENKIWTVEFFETGVPFHFSEEPKDATDPFWAQSYKVRSTETVAEYLVASTGEESTSKKQSLDDSIVSYLLSDLLQGSASGIVLGCLRANESSYAENASTLESLSRLDELFHEKHGGLDDSYLDGQEGHSEEKVHDVETSEAAYNIPVDLQKWLNDCQSEMQNFTRLIEKDSSRYTQLRFPHPDEPRPFIISENISSNYGGKPLPATEMKGSDAAVNREEEAAALENQPVLQTIKKRIGYYMQKRHYLSQILSILSEIIQQSGHDHVISHTPPSQKHFVSEGIDDASISSSGVAEHRSFVEVNKVLESEMQNWLQEKGVSAQPFSLPDRAVDTDSLPSFSASISVLDEVGTAKKPTTSSQQENSPPYMILLSPNNLTEQYCRVDLIRGYTLLQVSRLSVLEPSRLHLRSVEEAVRMLDTDPRPNLEPEVAQPSPVGDKANASVPTKNQNRRSVSIEEPAKMQFQRHSDASSVTLGSFPKTQSSGTKKTAVSPPQSRGRTPTKDELQDDDDDDLTETLSVPAENSSRPPSPAKAWDVRVESVDPLRLLTRSSEEHRFLSQQTALQKSGVLPNPEQSEINAEKPKLLKGDVGPRARSITAATAQRIQLHRERKVDQQAADRQAAAAERAAEDAQHTLTLHISDRENPFSGLLGELNLLAVLVQRFDRVHLHPTSWHLKGRGGGGKGAPSIFKINSRCVEDVFDPTSAQNQEGRLHIGIELFDGDILQVGLFHFLEIHIPRKTEASTPPSPQLTRFEQALVKAQDTYLRETVFFEFLKEKRIAAHLNVQRELNAITKHKEKTRLMALQSFSPTAEEIESLLASTAPLMRFQIAQASLQAVYMTLLAFRLRRPIRYRCLLHLDLSPSDQSDPSNRDDLRACEILKKATAVEELLRILSFELDEPTLDVPDDESGHNKSSWLWPRSRFVHRLLCAADMLAVFTDPTGCDGDLSALSSMFPPSMDPLQDAAEDELVGVAFLNLDPLLHLLDVDDCVKIVNFNGDANGFVKLAVRSWIDKVEPVPHYITADVDVALKEFCGQGRKLISRFYFEFLSGLPAGHCSDCYVYFRFKKQFPVFLTPRYMGRCECPVLDCAVQVEEEVDEDLLRFLQSGCVEMEVFAKKKPALRQTLPTEGSGGWLFHKVGEANFAYLGDVHEEDVLAATAVALKKKQELEAQQAALAVPENYRVQNEQLQKQLQAMKQELNSKKKQLKMTSKLSDSLKVGRETQEKRDAEALSAVRLQLANLTGENSTLLKKLVEKETELTALHKKASRVCCIM